MRLMIRCKNGDEGMLYLSVSYCSNTFLDNCERRHLIQWGRLADRLVWSRMILALTKQPISSFFALN